MSFAGAADPIEQLSGGVTSVVLVDDAPEVRRLVRTALRFRGGFEVVGEAADGGEAVRLAGTEQPDIVVLDLGLPDISGRDVLGRIRDASPASKIVVFSGNADGPDRSWVAERVEGYVLKDAELDYLIDLLETLGRPREPSSAVLDLPRDLRSVREGRRFVRTVLSEWQLHDLSDVAQLVVSELVTNAITHAASSCQLRLMLTSSGVRVEVHDDGTGTPDPQPPSDDGEHGRGMYLIAACSTAWGIELLSGTGKVVWAELPLSASADVPVG
jgi:DNA-binding NarL/FixJ family response regulator